ncbi:NADH dehydrogenase [ubiquinone] 1 alpha subcomplex subunit 5-like [Tenrec ecaudatus]|uniref:NADH dehydrogenase [ubiquinone] 1 alpha subcomplex subunit 5-like n=1 Tax=Tenrec ecaudatus TaxID=94439 RepID=UPI003F5948E2
MTTPVRTPAALVPRKTATHQLIVGTVVAGLLKKTTGLVGLAVCETPHMESDVKRLEAQLQGGQIEEVILQVEKKLSLARKMIPWKPWEPLVEEPPVNQWKWPV